MGSTSACDKTSRLRLQNMAQACKLQVVTLLQFFDINNDYVIFSSHVFFSSLPAATSDCVVPTESWQKGKKNKKNWAKWIELRPFIIPLFGVRNLRCQRDTGFVKIYISWLGVHLKLFHLAQFILGGGILFHHGLSPAHTYLSDAQSVQVALLCPNHPIQYQRERSRTTTTTARELQFCQRFWFVTIGHHTKQQIYQIFRSLISLWVVCLCKLIGMLKPNTSGCSHTLGHLLLITEGRSTSNQERQP